MEQSFLTHLEAWRDFYDHVRPGIWGGLSRGERREINTAERDYHGRRLSRHGRPLVLTPERVERLLERFAPGRYGVERVVRFWRVDGG